jgi:hypothetical protein
MARPENLPPETENVHHTYVTNRIPWYVHLIWLTFWVLAVGYILVYQFPAIRKEFLNPP